MTVREQDTGESGALQAVVSQTLWLADIALLPGKLNTDDADAMCRVKAHMENSFQKLRETLSRLPRKDARAIDRAAADLLQGALAICNLHPIPTPAARTRVERDAQRVQGKTQAARARQGRSETPKAKAIAAACADAFAEKMQSLGPDWDGKRGLWTIAGHLMPRINQTLKQQQISELSQKAIWERFKKL